ncbi:MAG TPA: DMT family transporter [Candidatus Thermoplasmatota archaeon]|nr:DMT family transporter [Candidatus Thermoplasmatota archaeon]
MTRTWSYRAGVVFMLASGLSYGCVAVLAKFGLEAGWNVASLLAVRFAIGAAALAVLLAALREPALPTFREWPRVAALGALGIGFTSGLYFVGLGTVDAGIASVLLFTSPAMVALLSAFMGERLGGLGLAALGLSLLGVGFVATGGAAGSAEPVGVVILLLSALTYSVYFLAGRRIAAGVPAGALAVGVMASASAAFFLVAPFTPGGLALSGGTAGLLIAVALGVIGSAAALGCFFQGLPVVGASRAAILSTVEPLSTLLFAALFRAEIPSLLQLLGAAGILGAVILLAFREPGEGQGTP